MIHRVLFLLFFVALVPIETVWANDDDTYPADFGPEDALAAIDGLPILVGELNMILRPMANGHSVDKLPIDVHRAAAIVLVRRRIAMKQLAQQGGETLAAAIQRHTAKQTDLLERKGISLQQFADSVEATPDSVVQSWSWDAAWSLYLKSRLTDANLRKFYDSKRSADDASFDDLTDLRELRRQASDRLFSALVESRQLASLQWFIAELKPPAELRLLPQNDAS